MLRGNRRTLSRGDRFSSQPLAFAVHPVCEVGDARGVEAIQEWATVELQHLLGFVRISQPREFERVTPDLVRIERYAPGTRCNDRVATECAPEPRERLRKQVARAGLRTFRPEGRKQLVP